jgi:methylated-DNA-[protein]-cysteine S-methyltransferase
MKTKIIEATPFGSVAIIWAATDGIPKIIRILLSKPGLPATQQLSALYPHVQASSSPEIDDVAAGITTMLEGSEVDFPLEVADLSLCGEFQQRVLRAEHAIPRGRVSTYRLIARHLGKENGARAVGNALARNPFPLIVPCHRAIRSDRSLGGYQGGLRMKRTLLEGEGIRFDDSGRAQCLRLHYEI